MSYSIYVPKINFVCSVLLCELPGSLLSEDFTSVSIFEVLPGSYTTRIGRIRLQEEEDQKL